MRSSQAILILHHKGSRGWLEECLDSIDTHYPIIVSNHTGWCTPGIKKVFEETDYEEICILNETTICKDNSIWDIIFKTHKGKSVMLGENYLMFFGKYLRKHILPFPEVKNKREDVLLGEDIWSKGYGRLPIEHIPIQPLYDNYLVYEEKNGRNNMVLENDFFIKYKGSWNLEMID